MMGRKGIQPGDGDPRHGTANGYNNLGCHCEPCKAAWAVEHKRYMNADPLRLKRHKEREQRRRNPGRKDNSLHGTNIGGFLYSLVVGSSDSLGGSWWWECSCGAKGKESFQSPGVPFFQWLNHIKRKHNIWVDEDLRQEYLQIYREGRSA